MQLKAFLIAILFLGAFGKGIAQHHESTDATSSDSSEMFGKVLNSGDFEFHLRSYFMHTNNVDGLLDYSAWGILAHGGKVWELVSVVFLYSGILKII